MTIKPTIKLSTVRQMPCKAKIRDLHIQTVVEQNVFRFQVPVNNVPRVNVIDAFKDLPHDVAGLLLGQCHHRREIIEELTVTAQLKHQKDESIRLEHILEFNWK